MPPSSAPSTVPSSRRAARGRTVALLAPTRHPVASIVVAVATIVVLTALGFVLRAHPVDAGLSATLNTLRSGAVAHIVALAYAAFSPVPAMILTVGLTAVAWLTTRRLRLAAAIPGVVALTWIPSDIVKIVVARPRPDPTLLAHPVSPMPTDASFPSGHVVFATVLATVLVLLTWHTRGRIVALIAAVVLVAGMICAVTILAVHYPTDALASVLWTVGVFPAARLVWVGLLMPLVPALREPRTPAAPTAAR